MKSCSSPKSGDFLEHPLLIPFQLTTLHRTHRRFTGYLLCHLVIAESFWKLSNGLLHLCILFRLSLRCRTQFCHVLILARESLTSGSWERQKSALNTCTHAHIAPFFFPKLTILPPVLSNLSSAQPCRHVQLFGSQTCVLNPEDYTGPLLTQV